jgi:hypothetical protein
MGRGVSVFYSCISNWSNYRSSYSLSNSLFTNLGVSWFCPSFVCAGNLIVVVCVGWWIVTMCEGCWTVECCVGLCWTLCNFIGVVKYYYPSLTSLEETVLPRVTMRVWTYVVVENKHLAFINDRVILLCFFNF